MKKSVRILALLLALMLLFTGCKSDTEPTTTESEPTETTEPPSPLEYGKNDVLTLSSYATYNGTPELMQTVIAVDAEDQPCLTNEAMQIGFWVVFYDFMNNYGSYASVFGLDFTKPLSTQSCPEGFADSNEYTWEQYFLEISAKQLAENYALAQAAYADGYVLPAEDAAAIEAYDDPDGDFAAEALEAGYESVAAYLESNFGEGVTVAGYQDYMRTLYAASDYYNDYYDAMLEALTDAEVEAYYDENVESFEADRLLKVNNVSVRHILISPEGEKDAATNDWTEDQWNAALENANKVYELWLEDPTEENFAALVPEYTTDGGSKETGGLYEDFASNRMVEEFSDWCFDQSRVPGDSGIVKTEFGYHIMYFVEQTETREWLETAKNQMVNVKATEHIAELCERYPVRYDYKLVRIYDIITALSDDVNIAG